VTIDDYGDGEWVLLLEVADQLHDVAHDEQDCLSTLCTLSGVGSWTVIEGQDVYLAPCNDEDYKRTGEQGGVLVEDYTLGGGLIPTRVARRFGLDETNVCKSSGYILQGDDLIDRPVFQPRQEESGGVVLHATTLREIVSNDGGGDEDDYWKPLKWSHIQTVVDSSGNQSERFLLLAAVLRRLGEAEMDSETFIPYGMQFADSDFIDSF